MVILSMTPDQAGPVPCSVIKMGKKQVVWVFEGYIHFKMFDGKKNFTGFEIFYAGVLGVLQGDG